MDQYPPRVEGIDPSSLLVLSETTSISYGKMFEVLNSQHIFRSFFGTVLGYSINGLLIAEITLWSMKRNGDIEEEFSLTSAAAEVSENSSSMSPLRFMLQSVISAIRRPFIE